MLSTDGAALVIRGGNYVPRKYREYSTKSNNGLKQGFPFLISLIKTVFYRSNFWRYKSCRNESFPMKDGQSERFPTVKVSQV